MGLETGEGMKADETAGGDEHEKSGRGEVGEEHKYNVERLVHKNPGLCCGFPEGG